MSTESNMPPRPDLVAIRSDDQGRDSDVGFATVVWIGLAIALVTLAGYGVTAIYVDHLNSRPYSEDLEPSPMAAANQQVIPPAPRLQIQPEADLAAMLDAQRSRLESYEVVDQEQGQARIPIDRAIDLLVERGLTEERSQEDEQP